MRDKIFRNLILTAKLKDASFNIKGAEKFFLIGYVPVEIIWSNGAIEKTLIFDEMNVSFFDGIEKIMGKRAAKDMMVNKLKNEWIDELLNKLEKDITRIKRVKKIGERKLTSIKIITTEQWKKTVQ